MSNATATTPFPAITAIGQYVKAFGPYAFGLATLVAGYHLLIKPMRAEDVANSQIQAKAIHELSSLGSAVQSVASAQESTARAMEATSARMERMIDRLEQWRVQR